MKKTKSVLIVLAAACAMIGVICGCFSLFRKTFVISKDESIKYPAETVYYATEGAEEAQKNSVEIVLRAPSADRAAQAETKPEATAEAATETVPETTPETTPETVAETTETVETETEEETAQTEAEEETEATEEQTEPETTPVFTWKEGDGVPNFYETDYPQIRFMTGSFADYGSGVTSAAMVATYLTGYEYTPDQLAKWFSDYMGSQIQILEHISDSLQLPWYRAENFHVAKKALEEGKVAIVMVGSKSAFTTGQHFIVLTGINDDGLITVNDPNRNNYDKWDLKQSFESGFRDGQILADYKGAWIYDPEEIGEDHFRYEGTASAWEPRYPDLKLSEQEEELLAKVIFEEVQDKPFEGQQALAEVVFNRIMSKKFPDNLRGVLYQPGQFAGVNRLYAAKPTHVQYEAIRRALEGPYVLEEDVVLYSDVK